MEPISAERAIEIARRKGLLPGRVKGTDGIQFTKGNNDRLEVISWDEFRQLLERRGLQVYESGGWMKIMKRK
jgi:sugar phosphate isomerase/epimerase